MTKKAISVLLALIMALSVFTVLPATASAAEESDLAPAGSPSGTTGDCSWTFEPTFGTLTISGSGNMADYGSSYTDWVRDGVSTDKIKTVVVKSGVKNIGAHAFTGYTALTKVTMADTVTAIGDYAFKGCAALTDITWPAGLKTIGRNAFELCKALTAVAFPDKVTEIGDAAFDHCSALAEVRFPDGLKKVGYGAFNSCAVERAVFGKSIQSLGLYSFGYYTYYDEYKKKYDFPVYGYKDTEAEKYAERNGFTFVDRVVPEARCTVTQPLNGEKPVFKAVYDNDDNFAVTNVKWYSGKDDSSAPDPADSMSADDTFLAGGRYAVSAEFTGTYPYAVDSATKVYINDKKAQKLSGGTYYRGFELQEVGFAACLLGNVTAGNKPGYTSLYESEYYLTRVKYWYLKEEPYPFLTDKDRFEDGKVYAVRVSFTPKDGYTFTDNTEYSISGEKATYVGGDLYEATFTAHYETQYIQKVDITGVTVPAAGVSPSYTASVGSFDARVKNMTTGNYLNGICWFEGRNAMKPTTSTFKAGREYIVRIAVEPTAGYYQFTNGASATVNGKKAAVNTNLSTDKLLYVEYTFVVPSEPAIDGTISFAAVTGITKPAAGKAPSYSASVPSSAWYRVEDYSAMNFRDGVCWLDQNNVYMSSASKFEAGKRYTVRISLVPSSDNYVFAPSGISATVNGEIAKVSGPYSSRKNIYVEYTFTVPAELSKVNVKDVTEPVAGDAPVYSASVANGMNYVVETAGTAGLNFKNGVYWYNKTDGKSMHTDGAVFEAGKEYTVMVSLVPVSEDYEFANSGLTGTLNSIPAEVRIRSSRLRVYVVYTFICKEATAHYLIGDVNADGQVKNRDALILDRYIAGWKNYDQQIKNWDSADLNRDGVVKNRDALMLDRYIAGWASYQQYVYIV